MSKAQNVLLAAKTVPKTQKASRCETVKNPLGCASQRNSVENPKGRFECKTPFEFDVAFAVFIPLRVCVWPFGVYIPFLRLYFLLAPLAAYIFAYVHMHPFMGFQRTCTCIPLWDFWPFRRRVKPDGVFMPFRRRLKPYGFFIAFRGEWRHLGFSVRFSAMDTFWVLGIIWGV